MAEESPSKLDKILDFLSGIFKYLLRKTLPKLKIILFPVLVGGLTLDLKIEGNGEEETFIFDKTGDVGKEVIYVLGSIFILLIIIDYYHFKEQRKSRQRFVDSVMNDKSTTAQEKEKLLKNPEFK